jgi:hypothetical protein
MFLDKDAEVFHFFLLSSYSLIPLRQKSQQWFERLLQLFWKKEDQTESRSGRVCVMSTCHPGNPADVRR